MSVYIIFYLLTKIKMKKLILPAFMFLVLPNVSFALQHNIHQTVTPEVVETDVESTEAVEMTEAQKYKQRIERKRAYLRTLYRKNYQGSKTIKNIGLRRYENDVHNWEDTRVTIKSTAMIRATTQRASGGFKNYGEYLKDLLKKRRAQRKVKIRESIRMQEINTPTTETEVEETE